MLKTAKTVDRATSDERRTELRQHVDVDERNIKDRKFCYSPHSSISVCVQTAVPYVYLLPARRSAQRGLCRRKMSVCLSVTRRYCV